MSGFYAGNRIEAVNLEIGLASSIAKVVEIEPFQEPVNQYQGQTYNGYFQRNAHGSFRLAKVQPD
jgi:hypothetical protein